LFRSLIPSVDFCSLRFVDRSEQKLSVRQGIVEPVDLVFLGGSLGTGFVEEMQNPDSTHICIPYRGLCPAG